jgi:hypothetical protein
MGAIRSKLNVGTQGDVIVTASKLSKTSPVVDSIQINNEQPALNVSIKMDGTLSGGKTVASTLADTSHHLFCESN